MGLGRSEIQPLSVADSRKFKETEALPLKVPPARCKRVANELRLNEIAGGRLHRRLFRAAEAGVSIVEGNGASTNWASGGGCPRSKVAVTRSSHSGQNECWPRRNTASFGSFQQAEKQLNARIASSVRPTHTRISKFLLCPSVCHLSERAKSSAVSKPPSRVDHHCRTWQRFPAPAKARPNHSGQSLSRRIGAARPQR